ncbi:hypothetical protein BD309DRAFT_995090 [Dichomitus squalens]|uniref:Uncharacterized protein n=1 Tax=Dichomitus squalens TaxID=114155 RepID=A0A4Q9N9G2_9APHY|nr:hypothetical protein BD309DRAFT_995090 [Dichomitus squalens]TBU51950.1 hypothetical protein BD310DRAFT_833242 [Dichomitus squalens]
MSAAGPSRKRARVNSTATDDAVPLAHRAQGEETKRDQEFWFEDGNVTLIAGNFEFRVYKGVLSNRSPVFRDMFSLPQQSPSTPSTCPTVHLSDSPEDVRELLRALIPGIDSSHPFSLETQPSYQTISASIRLGHKYQLDRLVDAALAYLRRYYTTDYDTWHNIHTHCKTHPLSPVHAIGVVNLARLTGADDILPSALYACCTLEGPQLVEGFQREDGTPEVLSNADLARCIQGKANLTKERVGHVVGLHRRFQSPNCKQRCSGGAVIHKIVSRIDCAIHPCAFEGWTWPPANGPGGNFCPHCLHILNMREHAQKQDLWNRLPELMGVMVDDWKRKEIQIFR